MAKANKNNTSRNTTTSTKAAAQASPVAPVVAQQAPAAAQAPAAVVAPAKPVGHINSLANVLAPAPVAKASTAQPRTGACNTRPGTKAALICGALTAEPQSMKALMAAAGQGQTFYNLLNGLVAKGLVAKHPCGGYSLPAAQPTTTPAAQAGAKR